VNRSMKACSRFSWLQFSGKSGANWVKPGTPTLTSSPSSSQSCWFLLPFHCYLLELSKRFDTAQTGSWYSLYAVGVGQNAFPRRRCNVSALRDCRGVESRQPLAWRRLRSCVTHNVPCVLPNSRLNEQQEDFRGKNRGWVPLKAGPPSERRGECREFCSIRTGAH
jgi:hypothetical protein